MALLRNDQHTLTGVYALDALDTAAEVARFERHMNRCDSCTSEVRGFRETATRLGMAVSRQPPPALRTAVMAEVARTRQLAALDDRARHARPVPRLTLPPIDVALETRVASEAVRTELIAASWVCAAMRWRLAWLSCRWV